MNIIKKIGITVGLSITEFLIAQTVQTQRPKLHFPVFNLFPADSAGGSISSTETQASIQQGTKIFAFDTLQPSGNSLRVLTVPEGLKYKAQGQALDGYLYFSQRREILRVESGRLTPSSWFQSERSFQGFQIFDMNVLALVWTGPQAMGLDSIVRAFDGETLRQHKACLIELWDVPSKTCLETVPIPETILTLLDKFEAFPLLDVRTFRGGDHLLIFFPLLGLMYDYDTVRKSLQPLKVPWDAVEATWVFSKLRGTKATSYSILNFFLVNDLTASPMSGGGLRFAYNSLPLREDTLAAMGPAVPKNSFVLSPKKPTSKGDTSAELNYYLAEWRPGLSEIVPMQSSGTFLMDDHTELRRRGWDMRFQREGIFISWSGVPRPMNDFVNELLVSDNERNRSKTKR